MTFRKLGGKILFGKRDSLSDMGNFMIAHEGFILDDGTTIGFFPDGIRVDTGYTTSDYSQLKYYDDNILQQAIGITHIGKYNIAINNCQHWAKRVNANYHKLSGK